MCTTGTSQVHDRGQSAWVVGARVTLEMTDDIWSIFIFHVGYVVFIRVCIDSCISRQISCNERFVYCMLLSERHVVSFISTFSDVHSVDVLYFLITTSA